MGIRIALTFALVPTLCVGMHSLIKAGVITSVTGFKLSMHYHAEHGNEFSLIFVFTF